MINFGGIDADYASREASKVGILPVPYDVTTSYRSGTDNGPKAIIEASTQLELYDEELKIETYRIGITTMDELKVRDIPPEEMLKSVYEAGLHLVKAGKFPVVLGGEHTVTIGIVKALMERYQDLSIVQFDAHADLRDEYEDRKFSHACVGRRLSELGQLLQLGVRSLSQEEAEIIPRTTVKTINAADIIKGSGIEKEIIPTLSDRTYITIDLDVLDPSIMPSVGTPVPGGLGWYEMLDLLKYLSSVKEIVGFDVVELSPIPGNIAPDFIAAKLVYRLLGYIFNEDIS